MRSWDHEIKLYAAGGTHPYFLCAMAPATLDVTGEAKLWIGLSFPSVTATVRQIVLLS